MPAEDDKGNWSCDEDNYITGIRIDRRCTYHCSKFAWAYFCAMCLTYLGLSQIPFSNGARALSIGMPQRESKPQRRFARARRIQTLPPAKQTTFFCGRFTVTGIHPQSGKGHMSKHVTVAPLSDFQYR